MTKTERENKLIARFLGLSEEVAPEHIEGTNMYFLDGEYKELQYDTSWDWLMKAVDKICELGHSVSIENWTTIYFRNKSRTQSLSCKKDDRFTNTYNVVVRFIKKYNKGEI